MAYRPIQIQSHELPLSEPDEIRPHPQSDPTQISPNSGSNTYSPFPRTVSHSAKSSLASNISSDPFLTSPKVPQTVTFQTGRSSTQSFHSQSSKRSALSKSGSWTLEIITLLISLGSVGAIIGVLARYNGHSLPSWPYYITLNALIALLATVANATMSVTLSSGIGQLKWIQFKETEKPLADLEIWDEASRGTWGAMRLLGTGKGGWLGSLGAIIAIVALALGPFAQQIASYRLREVESDFGALIPRAMNFTPALMGNTSSTGFVPILPLKAAVYNGLFAENNRPAASLPFTCQSGNCHWPEYDSLAVCHECIDISSLMSRYCAPEVAAIGNNSMCGWQVPQGARLNTSSDVFSLTSLIPTAYGDMPHSTLIRLIFMGTELQDTPDELNPWATQCTLQACANTMSSEITNGTLQETIVSSKLNHTVVDMSAGSTDADYGVYIKGASGENFLLGMGAMLSIRGWFSALMTNGSATRNTVDFDRSITDADRAVVVNLTVGISSGETFFDNDITTAFYWNYYEYADGLNMLMRDLAISMTTAFRGFNGAVPVNGKSVEVESYVHVRWGFAVLPIAVVIAAVVFLCITIVITQTSRSLLWKSSALALIFHGLDPETRERFAARENLGQRVQQAKKVKVKLDSGETDPLLRGRKTEYLA